MQDFITVYCLPGLQVKMKKPVMQDSQVEIIRSGQFYTLLLGKQISLSWDKGTRLLVHMSSTYRVQIYSCISLDIMVIMVICCILKKINIMSKQGRVCGLCGNFDGNVNNDLMSSNNQLEVDSSHFGNSWKVLPSCADVTQVSSGLKLKDYCMQAFIGFDLEHEGPF